MTNYRLREITNRYGTRYEVQIIVHGRHLAFKEFKSRPDAEAFIASRQIPHERGAGE